MFFSVCVGMLVLARNGLRFLVAKVGLCIVEGGKRCCEGRMVWCCLVSLFPSLLMCTADGSGGAWQKGKLVEAAGKSEEDMASWNREGDAPWKKGKASQI